MKRLMSMQLIVAVARGALAGCSSNNKFTSLAPPSPSSESAISAPEEESHVDKTTWANDSGKF